MNAAAARKKTRLKDFLTDGEIIECIHIKNQLGANAARVICEKVVKPNLKRINETLRQENDAMYLAYAIERVLNELGVI